MSIKSEQEATLGLVQNVLKMDEFLSCYVIAQCSTHAYVHPVCRNLK